MRLTPREQDRLQLFLAAELARKRRARGLTLNQAEATALIADEVCEAARDGRSYEEAVAAGYATLGPADVLDGVDEIVSRIEVEALFGDGSRLCVLTRPIAASGPPPERDEPPLAWLPDAHGPLAVENAAEVAIGITSHFHVFELNRRLCFDRRAAWGMRLAVEAGVKLVIEPGASVDVWLRPFEGARVIRGHGGLVDGPLDDPGALEQALELARERGYLGV